MPSDEEDSIMPVSERRNRPLTPGEDYEATMLLAEYRRIGARLKELGVSTHPRELTSMTRQELFDALPLYLQAALPTWPLPTRAQILHRHAVLRERANA